MEQLGTGGRLTVAIGVAGSGKSTLLKPLVDAWKEDGRAGPRHRPGVASVG